MGKSKKQNTVIKFHTQKIIIYSLQECIIRTISFWESHTTDPEQVVSADLLLKGTISEKTEGRQRRMEC